MYKTFLSCCLIAGLINCATMNESGRMEVYERNPRKETFDRARALDQIGESNAAARALTRIIDTGEVDDISIDAVLLLADIYLRTGHPKDALSKLKEFSKKGPGPYNFAKIEKAIARAQKQVPVQHEKRKPEGRRPDVIASPSRAVSKTIGLILPLSGAFKIYGERILGAIKLALPGSLAREDEEALIFEHEGKIALVVIDSMGLPQVSAQAVNVLTEKFNVGVILGDILSDTALAIAKQTTLRDVINISLSRRDGISKIGPRVFRMAVTPHMQTDALLRSPERDVFSRVAILYPENQFGREMRDAFATSAKKSGSLVTKSIGYNPSQTTYTSHIRQLVGAKNTNGNEIYTRCMEKASQISDTAARKKAERDCYDNVSPRVEFEALFLPDFPKNVGYIVPALISEGVMVSQNDSLLESYRRTTGYSQASAIQLLGPTNWNNGEIGEKLGLSVEGASFVDCGEYDESRGEVSKFNVDFREKMGSGPLLSEAIAYDAFNVVREILAGEGSEDKVDLNQIMTKFFETSHNGLVGSILFNSERESIIPLHWFWFQDGKILRRY